MEKVNSKYFIGKYFTRIKKLQPEHLEIFFPDALTKKPRHVFFVAITDYDNAITIIIILIIITLYLQTE